MASASAPAVLTIPMAEALDEHPAALRFVIREVRASWAGGGRKWVGGCGAVEGGWAPPLGYWPSSHKTWALEVAPLMHLVRPFSLIMLRAR